MRYLEISNIGVITKDAIELLGFSDKRSRTDLIGEKGTGLKFSRLQCMRKGIDFFVTTSEFKSWYSSKSVDLENEQVIFQYEEKNGKRYAKPSSFTVQAGFSDWTDDWFIVREIIQNAVDEMVRSKVVGSRDEGMNMVLKGAKIVHDVSFAKKGNTNVYLELTSDIERVFTNLSKYFVYKPIFSCEHGSLHEKQDKNLVQIYKQGIFIQEYKTYSGLYDYECSKVELQENRTPKYMADISDEILKVYSEAPTKFKREFLRYVNGNTKSFELEHAWEFTKPLANLEDWTRAFYEEFGDKAVIHNDIAVPAHIAEKAKMHDRRVVILRNPLYNFLSGTIQTLVDLTSTYEELLFREEPLEAEKAVIIEESLNKALPMFNKKVPVGLFSPLTDLEHNTAGVFLPRHNKILINKNKCSSIQEVLPIILEELIHAESGADDLTRAFQDCALRKLSDALLKFNS